MFRNQSEAVEAVLAAGAVYDGYRENADGGEYLFSPEGGFGPESQWCGLAREHDFRVNGMEPGGPVLPRLYYTPSATLAFMVRGRWIQGQPNRGDLVLFNWEAWGFTGPDPVDHIGIVLDGSTWDQGYITTRESNIDQGDGIPSQGIFTRSTAVISGFGRPDWDAAVSGTTPTSTTSQQEDPMIILRNPKGWHVVMGDHLIRVGGSQDFNMVRADVERNTVRIDVSDAQLAQIKAEFAK
jgi:hypothetical protein